MDYVWNDMVALVAEADSGEGFSMDKLLQGVDVPFPHFLVT